MQRQASEGHTETMPPRSAEIDWSDTGTPLSRHFDDPYFSQESGLEEARHVFLAGNDLQARFRDGFQIAELGFGSGLNLLATLCEWRKTGISGRLHYTAFELWPMAPADMERALAAFPELEQEARMLLAALASGPGPYELPDGVCFTLITGDVRATLPAWQGRADAWFLDGFAPAKNPEMWEESLLAEVARHMTQDGTLATYTAAGHVRRTLAAAGLAVERVKGFGHKRHMTRARRA